MLLGLGDNCVDIYVEDGLAFPGGNAVNVAVFARQLGCDAHYAGRFGEDAFGRFLAEEIAAVGVGVEGCRFETGEATAWTRIGLRDGDRVFLASHAGPAGPFRLDERQRALAARASAIHTSVYSNLPADELARLRRPGCLISLDAATRAVEDVDALLPLVDVAAFSAPFLSAEAHRAEAAAIAARGPSVVVLGHGDRGATILSHGRAFHQPAAPAAVVDTLGAGDAFLARILAGLLRDESIDSAAAAASVFAARACERRGAFGAPRRLGSVGIAR